MIRIHGLLFDKLVLASGNRHKYEEFKQLLAPLHIQLFFGGDFSSPIDVEETGNTFEENAALKACAWARYTGLPAVSDDSGIEVRALGWQPGIHSARIAPDDEACRQWLIAQMADKTDRCARYAAALVLAFPDTGVYWSTLCHCEGSVIQEKRGTNGFGYDPLFIPDGYTQTFGELPPEVKSKLSHRAKASAAFIEMLKKFETEN
ncbi:MAG: RdgB/HAM1 family non-canonical purine NTP pyrophosphatase [Pyramidobacter sp.]|nr:RdgB/HAM1 family non-canonical purine NTP pyrophosphatase [Pyramidobacter sp.]